jgi:hypothetical protein
VFASSAWPWVEMGTRCVTQIAQKCMVGMQGVWDSITYLAASQGKQVRHLLSLLWQLHSQLDQQEGDQTC